jgi:methylmalonyl-CoA mutase cobalamin-binding domain/chain
LVPRVIEGLAAEGLSDVIVVVGGIIPERDIEALRSAGVSAVFTPGAHLPQIASWLEEALDTRERAGAGQSGGSGA